MTVSTTNNRIAYNGNAVTVAFAFPYYFLQNADLKVYVGGVLKVLTTDYSITGAGAAAGGTVTFVVAPAVGTGNITILRDPDALQSTSYPSNDSFPSASHEKALDKLTMLVQRFKDLISRALVLGDADISGSGSFDALNNKIKNLTAGTLAGDAINKAQLDAAALAPVTPTAASIANVPAGNISAVNVQTALNQLDTIKQPLDSKLTAFSGLTGAADQLPYFTGAAAMAVTPLSSFIRTLLDDVDAATARATLGITSTTAASKSDQTAGTSNVVFITPLHQQEHDSACKAFYSITNSGGAVTTNRSYGHGTITRSGAGIFVSPYSNTFADTGIAIGGMYNSASGANNNKTMTINTLSTTSLTINFGDSAGTPTDPAYFGTVLSFGRIA